MAIEVLAVPTANPRASSTAHAPSFYQRRADWQANGAAHDRAVRGRIVIAAPVLLVVVAIVYTFIGR